MAEKAANKDPEYFSDSSTTGEETTSSSGDASLTSYSSSAEDDSSTQQDEDWALPKHSNVSCEYISKGGFNEGLIRDLCKKSVLEAYERFVDEEVLQFIVEETNRYALYKLEGNWETLTVMELRKVVALLVWMLIVVPCSRADILWSDDPYLQVSVPKQVIPDGERFEKILRMLHFSNNEDVQPHVDKASSKVKQLTDMMVARFQAAFTPERDVVVDEKILMPYKNFRILRLASPHSYTWNAKVLAGYEPGSAEYRAEVKHSILELMSSLGYSGRVMYTTKEHTSVGLANEMLSHKTNCVGELHPYKGGAPLLLVKRKVTKEKVVDTLENSKGVRVMKCNSGREKYLFLSTIHDPGDILDKTDRKGKVKKYPRVIVDHKKVMDTLDEADEMMPPVLEDGENGRYALKWYQRYGLELVIGYSVINAYLLYKAANQDDEHNIHQREFNLRLVKDLLNKCGVEIAPVLATGDNIEQHSSSEKSYNSFSFESDEAMLSGDDGHHSSD